VGEVVTLAAGGGRVVSLKELVRRRLRGRRNPASNRPHPRPRALRRWTPRSHGPCLIARRQTSPRARRPLRPPKGRVLKLTQARGRAAGGCLPTWAGAVGDPSEKHHERVMCLLMPASGWTVWGFRHPRGSCRFRSRSRRRRRRRTRSLRRVVLFWSQRPWHPVWCARRKAQRRICG